jgi:hypothetical protein
MKMSATITTPELDGMARLGFDDLRAAFIANPPEGVMERAKLSLKLIALGTGRMGAENSRLSMAFKMGKAVGATVEELRPVFMRAVGIEPASCLAALESPDPLAATESTSSGVVPPGDAAGKVKKPKRSRKQV